MPKEIQPVTLNAATDTTRLKRPCRTWALRKMHRTSAFALSLFIGVHLLGHLAGLAGVAAHQSMLDLLRVAYRQPVVEALLLGCVVFQAVSGLVLLWLGRGHRKGFVARLQALSGAYLGLFLLVHVGAVLQGRVSGLDTNLHFAAAGMHVSPWPWFFGPYYFLAVFALGTHIGCALYWKVPPSVRAWALAGAMFAGLLLATCLVALLAGVFGALEIPPRYLAPFAELSVRG